MGEHVVVLSRAGTGSLTPTHTAQIEEQAALDFVVCHDAPGPVEAAHLLRRATVLGTTNATLPHLDDNLLERLPHLHSIVLYATGYEHLQLDALARHDLTLTTLPDYATGAVAEHALGMLLSLATRSHLANDRSRGRVPAQTSLRGVELCGSTLGVIGIGRIGLHLARIATGIGMRVIGADPDPAARRAAEHVGIETTSTEDLLHRARAVTICASTTPHGGPIIDLARLGMLQPGALLVNVGRPCLVDTDAVVAALRLRHLRGYAVDDAPFDRMDHADLLAEGRILQTGHSAWWRDEVLARGAEHFGRALVAAVHRRHVDVVSPAHRVAVTSEESVA
ncbi:Lactate dehydrogenase [Janibacter indicus]|uniref:Lactate dehydrogenase n=1 Tax=Janibacter indicus TaxID=857417 RepID=A0A1W2CUU7_9MICO|nr:Lactate dehydrogenase [Janibacter indicus]